MSKRQTGSRHKTVKDDVLPQVKNAGIDAMREWGVQKAKQRVPLLLDYGLNLIGNVVTVLTSSKEIKAVPQSKEMPKQSQNKQKKRKRSR